MATKRIAHVILIKADGTEIPLDGAPAESAIHAWNAWKTGASYYGVITYRGNFTPDGGAEVEDVEININMRCICELVILPYTEEDFPDRPCEDLNCIQDYDPDNQAV